MLFVFNPRAGNVSKRVVGPLLSLGGWLLLTPVMLAQGEYWPGVEKFLAHPAPANTPVISMSVSSAPVDVQVPTSGGVEYIHDKLSDVRSAMDLQDAIEFHARDANLGDPNSIGYRLRVVVRGVADFASTQNGTARALNQRALAGDAKAKALASVAADRRDAAKTLASWAALELFRAEGGDFSPAALRKRMAEYGIGVDWEKIDRDLRVALNVDSGNPQAAGEDGGQNKRFDHQSITFERSRVDTGALGTKVFEPGQDGGGVEVFTVNPTMRQMNRSIGALRVRVDMPSAPAGSASWQDVRHALSAEAYNTERYLSLDPEGTPAQVLQAILKVAYQIQKDSQGSFRQELNEVSGGDRQKLVLWRQRALQVADFAGCPPRLRAAGQSYLAAKYWADGVRTALIRRAGIGALESVGGAPTDDTL